MGAAEVEQFHTHLATDRSEDVRLVPARLDGEQALIADLLYGAGLRLIECMRLRVKDVDFGQNQIVVRYGKGGKGRLTMLPARHVEPLQRQRRG